MSAFSDCDSLKTVCYLGTLESRNHIDIDVFNHELKNAEWIYHKWSVHSYDDKLDTDCNECGAVREAIILGDLDRDGQITVADALVALRIAARMAYATDIDFRIGDLDEDWQISVADALAILRIAAKMS